MLINLGATLVRLGHYDEAGKTFLQAPARSVDRKTRTSVLVRQTYLRVLLKQPAEAVETAQAALESAKGFPDLEAGALCALGVAHREAGNLPAARLELTQALALAHERQDRSDEADIGFPSPRPSARPATSKPPWNRHAPPSTASTRCAPRSTTSGCAARSRHPARRLRDLHRRPDGLADRGERRRGTGLSGQRAGARPQPPRRAERLGSRGQRGGRLRPGEGGASPARRAELPRLLPLQAAEREKPDRQKLADTEHRLEETLDQYRKAQAALRASSPGYAALTQPQPLSLAEIRSEALDGRALLLEYALGARRSYLWVVTPERSRASSCRRASASSRWPAATTPW